MVKDRLAELQSLSGKGSNRSPSGTVLFNGTGVRIEDGFPVVSDPLLEKEEWEDMDNFLANVNNIRTKIDEMDVILKRLKEVHRHIVTSPGCDPKFNAELTDLTERFKAISTSVHAFLRGLKEEVKRLEDRMEAADRIKKNHAMTLNKMFENVLKEFNEEQLFYKGQCEKTITKYLQISGIKMDEEQVDDAIEKGQLFNTVSLMMGDREKKVLYEEVQNRHDDIIKLEASIRELHEMFQDVFMLVESQGELIDRIETNVEYATEYARKALSNVHQAQEAKKRNIMLKIGLVACGFILVILLFIILSTVFCLYLPFACRS